MAGPDVAKDATYGVQHTVEDGNEHVGLSHFQ